MSVYSIGNGKANGELGTGNFEEQLDPAVIESILGKSVVTVKACEANALAITETGDLYTWGRNREGTLGIGSTEKSCPYPVKVTLLEGERIVSAAVGSNHVLAVSKRGRVYHWGKLFRCTEEAQKTKFFGVSIKMIGLANDEEDESTARKRRLLDRSHRAYLANKGGRGNTGDILKEGDHGDINTEFGNFTAYFQRTPLLIEEFTLSQTKICKVAAGYGFSLFVSDRGQVWSMGINEKFQLGIGHRFNQDKPQLIKSLEGVVAVEVACGQQHSLLLDDNGYVWSWGLGVFGQLGHSSLRDEPVPRKITTFTIQHVQAPVDDDQLEPMNLDPNLFADSSKILIHSIACGTQHSLALDSQGRIWSWGSSEYGQQGGTKNYEDLPNRQHNSKAEHFYYSIPRLLGPNMNGKRPVAIACGSLHNIALTDDGCVWTWGWGQTGALGHGNRRFQLFPTIINKLRGENIRSIAGGARTTFAVTSSSDSTFAYDFKSWVNNPMYSDLTIYVARGKSFFAHKAIVFTRCPHFLRIYEMSRRFTHTNSSELYLERVDPTIFLSLLNFLYTDHLRCPPHLVERLSAIAKACGLDRLRSLCERYLNIDEYSVGTINLPLLPSLWKEQFSELLNNPRWTDLTINLDQEIPIDQTPASDSPTLNSVVNVHKIFLHARCEFFSTMFQGKYFDSNVGNIDVDSISKPLFTDLLKFLYTNSYDSVSTDNYVDLLAVSDRFLVDLKNILEVHLEESMDDDTLIDALLISESTQTHRLRIACIERIVENLHVLLETQKLSKLKSLPSSTLRELDYICTKKGLISAGTLLRCQ